MKDKIAHFLFNAGIGSGIAIFGMSSVFLTKEFYQYVKKSPLCVTDVLAKGLAGRRDSPFE
tara:strand:- start:715 stop:897 length:183 start_codon:yes stop_codon:yes gene_type:complete